MYCVAFFYCPNSLQVTIPGGFMALKFEIDSLEGVDEAVKGLYVEHSGKYRLSVDGLPQGDSDVSGLKKKVDELLNEKKEAARKAKEAEEKAEAARLEAAKKNGDIDALQKSWEDKVAKIAGEKTAEVEGYKGMINSLTVGATATSIAAELAVPGSAEVLLPHVKNRLAVEIRENKPVVVVLDEQGKPSALTPDELKEEFRNKSAFAPLIAGSRATGAGHQGAGSGGAVKKFNEYTSGELTELLTKNPTLYTRLRDEYKKSLLK
jgi:hypothetical protein